MGIEHPDRLRRDERQGAPVAAVDLGFADRLVGREELPRLEGAEPVIQELARLGRAVPGGLEAADHHDEPLTVLDRRPGQRVAGFLEEPGLQPVGARELGQERIAVLLPDLVPGELPLA